MFKPVTPEAAGADGEETLFAAETAQTAPDEDPDADVDATADPVVSEAAAVAAVDDGEIILTIKGTGLLGPEKNYTLAQLSAMEQTENVVYSAINTYPSKKWYVGTGVRLADLLKEEELSSDATSLKFTASDGYNMTLTIDEALRTPRYCFRMFMINSSLGYIPGISDGSSEVPTIMALKSAENTNDPNRMNDIYALTLMLGQRAVTEQTGELFVKSMGTIEVLTSPVPRWDTPRAAPAGGELLKGSQVELFSDIMDSDKIYYTTDGSDPGLNSTMYNYVADRWKDSYGEELARINKPITISEDTVIKAVTIGPGRRDSEVAEFRYTAIDPGILIEVEPREITLFTDGQDTATLTVNTEPAEGVALYFTSSNQDVATVDPYGRIKAVGAGGASVTVTAVKEGYTTTRASVLVEVNPSEDVDTTPPVWPDGAVLTGEVINGKDVRLIWPEAMDDDIVDGYQVHQDDEQIDYVAGVEYIVKGLSDGKYHFSINAVDRSGNTGQPLSTDITVRDETGGGPSIDDPNVALYIFGDGVAGLKAFTEDDLKNMEQITVTYSAINTFPTKKWCIGKGVRVRDLLDKAGINSNATMIRFTANDSDNYRATLTMEELGAQRYYFPNFKADNVDADGHIPGNSAGAQQVETILALESASGTRAASYMNDTDALLLMLGQRSVTEQTEELFVRKVKSIEVLTTPASKWDVPASDTKNGAVAYGAEIELKNDNMNNAKIYYTTDGSTPNINSAMYNYISSRWWSARGPETVAEINKPIVITKDTVVKAVTIGPGRQDSDVAEFSYTVQSASSSASGAVTPENGGTVSLKGEIEVVVPPGAVNDNVNVTVERLAKPPLAAPAGFKFLGDVYDFSVDGHSVYSFSKNVSVRLFFDAKELAQETIPLAFCYDPGKRVWVELEEEAFDDYIAVAVDRIAVLALMVALPDSVTALIKPDEGGTVSLNDEAIIEIPAGALTGKNDAAVGVRRLAEYPALPEGWQMLGAAYQFSVDDRTDYKFNKNVTIELRFDPETLSGEETPVMYYYDEARLVWVELAGDVTNEHYMAVQADFTAIFALLLPAPVDLPAPLAGYSTMFTDISGHWAEAVIDQLADQGIIGGYPDGDFQPDSRITRAEFATVLVRGYHLTGQGRQPFTDTAGHWAEESVGIAVVYGVIGGYDADYFGPDDYVTREQMTLMMVRAARLALEEDENLSFDDSDQISDWAREAVAAAVSNNVVQGYSDNTFRPGNNATRAEAVQVIFNALSKKRD